MNDTTRQKKRQNSQQTFFGTSQDLFFSLIFLFRLMSHDDKLEGWMYVLQGRGGAITIKGPQH